MNRRVFLRHLGLGAGLALAAVPAGLTSATAQGISYFHTEGIDLRSAAVG